MLIKSKLGHAYINNITYKKRVTYHTSSNDVFHTPRPLPMYLQFLLSQDPHCFTTSVFNYTKLLVMTRNYLIRKERHFALNGDFLHLDWYEQVVILITSNFPTTTITNLSIQKALLSTKRHKIKARRFQERKFTSSVSWRISYFKQYAQCKYQPITK